VRWVWPLAVLGGASAACTTTGSDPCGADSAPGTLCPIAGTGDLGFNGDGLPARETSFYLPSQVRRGPDGLLYIMDFNNHRLRRIEKDGTVTTIAGDGFHAGAVEGIPATESPLENPIDFDFLPDGRIVFVSYHDPRVLLDDSDGTLRAIAGGPDAGERGDEGDGGPPLFARFVEIHGIAVASDGTIYIADSGANRVRVIRGGVDGSITTFAGSNALNGYTGDGGPATAAKLAEPSAIALDGNGNVYFTDSTNCVVRKVDASGLITTVAGTGPNGELSHPDGIAIAPDGTLFVGDKLHAMVRKVAADGTLTTIAGTGDRGLKGDGGPAIDAELGYVARIQLDLDGSLLIADQTNAAVRRLVGPL
jgi:sugar lactone lactonase YvrE